MVTVWKEILKPDTYRLRNGRVVKFTKDDVSNGEKQGKDMIAAGLNIPIAFEHQSTASPEYLSDIKWTDEQKAEFVRNTAGSVKDFRVSPNGVLEAQLEFRDQKDADVAAKAKFVSPRIDEDSTDSKGRTWVGKTVAHVALTPVPVQIDQEPFNLSALTGGWKPRTSEVLSVTDDDESESKKDDSTSTPKPTNNPAIPSLSEFVKVLSECGCDVGDNVIDLNDLFSRLKGVAAIMSKSKDADDGLGALAGEGQAKSGPNPPTLMSALDKREVALKEAERRELSRRVDRLFADNKISGTIQRKLKTELSTINLSFTDSGELADNKFITRIEAYEALEPGVFKDKTVATDLSAIAPPKEFDTKKDGQEAAAKWLASK